MKKWMYRTIAGFLLDVLLTGALAGVFGMEAQAAEKSDYDKDDFTIETELSLSQDGETYDVHIEITNAGKDFEGTVRVIAENDYSRTCAYDTALSLSEGSTKQFTVSIPMSSLNSNSSTRGMYVILLDQKGIAITEKYYRRFFEDYVNHVSIGILSNDYLALDYLDLNGDTAYIINDNYPLELVELTKDTVEEQLAELDYLVIDQYDTSVLPAGTIAAIEKWTKQGGMLIFGTGTYAYEVLNGFDRDFLQTSCLGICHPDTGFESEYKGDMYSVTGATDPYDYYGISLDMYLSMDNFANSTYNNGASDTAVMVDTAILENFSQNSGMYHYGYGYGSTIPAEDGSITYMYYALSDPDIASACAYEPYVTENMLEMAADTTRIEYSSFHQTTANGVKYGSYFEEALGIIDLEKSSLNFNVLKVIIVIYVGLVGPGIYLILRALKKRELYWVAVPVLAFLFVGIVSLAGRGFRVADMTVCSVTFVDAGGSGKTGTVFSAYSADHDDWQIKMTENFAYAGPLQSSYGYGSDPLEYYYQVSDDISGLSVGLRPDASFETAMFQGRMSEPTGGELEVGEEEIYYSSSGLQGLVTNRTGYDFPYMAVLQDESIYVFEDVKDGETVDLSRMDILTVSSLSGLDEIFWREIEDYYDNGEKETAAMLSAMYIGLVQAGEYTDTVVIGVTPEYERVTEGNYAETSYGCFYNRIQ